MIESARGPAVVDTGVFGATMTPSGKPLASGYKSLLEGRRSIISFITAAELRFGASFFNVEDLQLLTKLPKLGVPPVPDEE